MDRGVCNALRLLLRRKFHPAEYDAFVPAPCRRHPIGAVAPFRDLTIFLLWQNRLKRWLGSRLLSASIEPGTGQKVPRQGGHDG
jgi:hypothetical protein